VNVPAMSQDESVRTVDASLTAPGSAQVIQVETLGKHGLLLLFLCAFIAALSAVGFIFTLFELKTVSAQYEVLQYDQQALKAQLVAKGIYQATEH
jgi:hypothetical protein